MPLSDTLKSPVSLVLTTSRNIIKVFNDIYCMSGPKNIKCTSVNKGGTQWSPPSTPCHSSRYSMVYRGCSKEYLLQAKIKIFFSLYQFSPTKHQNIEKILSDSEP